MATDRANKVVNTNSQSDQNQEEEIRRRAYQHYEERGREDGHDIDDWLRAEAEITGAATRTAAA